MIDGHINVTWGGDWGKTSHDASMERLQEEMEKAGIERGLLLAIRGFTSNRDLKAILEKDPDAFWGFGSLGVGSWKEDLEEIEALGLHGVKFHPRIQEETLEDWDGAGVLKALAERRMPVMVCGWLQSKEVPIDSLLPLVLDRYAKRYPALPFILSHMGGHRFWDALFCARSNDNVHLDCSYFLKIFEGTSLERDLFRGLGLIDQKVFYGSDFPECSCHKYLERFREKLDHYGKEGVDLEGIFSKNLLRLLG